MKKMLFLMLFLLILGAANVNSQVRIGGNGVPNGAAVLDLNATDAINNGTKGLALPRVSLTDINTALAGSPTVNGMMVYNTNASVTGGSGAGIYYWDGSEWQTVGPAYTGSTSITLSGDSFQRAALTGAVTADANSNLTSLAPNAVDSAAIAPGAVGARNLRLSSQVFIVSNIPASGFKDTVIPSLTWYAMHMCNFNFYSGAGREGAWTVSLRALGTRTWRFTSLVNYATSPEVVVSCFAD